MNKLEAAYNTVGVLTDTYGYLQKSRNNDHDINELKILWAKQILNRLKVNVRVIGHPAREASMIFVGNHISYLDIPLLMSSVEKVSFVAKQELARWPIFGLGAKKIGTVFVKRQSGKSRHYAKQALAKALDRGTRIVVFPSGTTCMHESRPWRWGAFQVAYDTKSLIQPFRIRYTPMRSVAYIDRDFFPFHLLRLSQENHIEATLEFHEPVQINDPEKDSAFWHDWAKSYASEQTISSM